MDTQDQLKKDSYFELRNAVETAASTAHILPPYILSCLPKEKTGARVLDIGCGYGGLLKSIGVLGYYTKGIDINTEAITYCKKEGLQADLIGNITDYTVPPEEKFDLAIMTHVIEHLKKADIIDILRHIQEKLLKPGGSIYIATPNAQARTGAYWMYEDFTHETIFTSGSMYYVLKAAGFKTVDFLDKDGVENSRIKIFKLAFIKAYRFFDWFVNKFTGGAYHPPSPVIYTWELKVKATK